VIGTVPENFSQNTECDATLTYEEKQRAARFKFDYLRNNWIYGRTVLKKLLAYYLCCETNRLRVEFNTAGKPYLFSPKKEELNFNYSGSNNQFIFAFSKNLVLGVDIENISEQSDYHRLSSKVLSNFEQDAINNLPENLRSRGFLANWTRKEAYGKTLGIGIGYKMNEVTLCRDFNVPTFAIDTDRGKVIINQVKPSSKTISCIASIGQPSRIEGYLL